MIYGTLHMQKRQEHMHDCFIKVESFKPQVFDLKIAAIQTEINLYFPK